jgi:hypothetical protein
VFTELSLPGVRVPSVGQSLPLIPCTAKLEPQWRLNLNRKQTQKAEKYDYKFRPNQVSHCKRSGRYEINASCDCHRFFGQAGQGGKS